MVVQSRQRHQTRWEDQSLGIRDQEEVSILMARIVVCHMVEEEAMVRHNSVVATALQELLMDRKEDVAMDQEAELIEAGLLRLGTMVAEAMALVVDMAPKPCNHEQLPQATIPLILTILRTTAQR